MMKREYSFKAGRRGALVPLPVGKTRITIRIDDDVLEWFRKSADAVGGGSYQSLINNVLREYIRSGQEELEEAMRRVVREELRRSESRMRKSVSTRRGGRR